MAEEQFVVFWLGDEEYAIHISEVREIIKHKGSKKLSYAPQFVEGVITLRGKTVPIVDLSIRFGLQRKSASDKKVIFIQCQGEKEIGIIVDEIEEIFSLDIKGAAPPTASSSYVQGIGIYDNRLIVLLNPQEIMTQKEFALVS